MFRKAYKDSDYTTVVVVVHWVKCVVQVLKLILVVIRGSPMLILTVTDSTALRKGPRCDVPSLLVGSLPQLIHTTYTAIVSWGKHAMSDGQCRDEGASHQGEFQRKHYMKVSVYHGDYDGVVRIFVVPPKSGLGDRIWQPKFVPQTIFSCQIWSPRQLLIVKNSPSLQHWLFLLATVDSGCLAHAPISLDCKKVCA